MKIWWIKEFIKSPSIFVKKLFHYIKIRGWLLPEITNLELLAGYLSCHGGVRFCGEKFTKDNLQRYKI